MRIRVSRAARFLLVFSIILLSGCGSRPASHNVIIRFRYWGDVKEIAAISKTIAEFEAAHPGVTVVGERVVGSPSDYESKLLVEQSAGLTPDVMNLGSFYPDLADHGIMTDLTPLIKSDPTVHLSDYYPEILKFFTDNGKIYGIPRDIAPEGLVFYNKSLFDKAHIPYPDGSWSWDYGPHPERGNEDFLTVAKKLTDPSSNPTKSVFGFGWSDPNIIVSNFVYSTGARYVDNIYRPTKVYFDDPRFIKALQLSQDLSFKYNTSPSSIDLQASGAGTLGMHDLFAQGRIAMYTSGIWDTPRFRTEIKTFDWDIAPFPKGPTGIRACQTAGSGYGISAACKHKQLAFEFVKWLTGAHGMTQLARAGVAQPANAKLAASSMWLDNQRPLNRRVTIETVHGSSFAPIGPDWPEISSMILDPSEELVWNGTISAKEAVSRMQPAAQAKLNADNHPKVYPKLNWWGGLVGMVCVMLAIVAWIWAGARRDIVTGRRIGRRSEIRAGWLFVSPWIIGSVLFVVAPVLVSLVLAFSSWDMLSPAKFVGIDNLKRMGTDALFWKSLEVTGVYTVFAVPFGVAGAMLLALLLNTKIRGQHFFRTLYYIPSIASAVAASLIWMKVFDPESGPLNTVLTWLHLNPVLKLMGLTDPAKGYVNWLGSEHTALFSMIVMSLWGVGGGMIIFLAGLQGIPQSYYDAADVDGAGVWQKFLHVTVPMLTPTIFFSLVMGFIGSFQVFTQGFVMTSGGPNNQTLFYVLYLYQNAFQYLKMGYASALAWVLFAIILAVTIVQMRTSKWVYYEGADSK